MRERESLYEGTTARSAIDSDLVKTHRVEHGGHVGKLVFDAVARVALFTLADAAAIESNNEKSLGEEIGQAPPVC